MDVEQFRGDLADVVRYQHPPVWINGGALKEQGLVHFIASLLAVFRSYLQTMLTANPASSVF